jgi:hypothetical protein
VLGIHPNIVNRWERGHAKIPPYMNWALSGITLSIGLDGTITKPWIA